MNPFKLILATSSTFGDYPLFRSKLDHLLQNQGEVEICTGFSKAGDALAAQYAAERPVTIKVFDPGFRGMYRALVYAEAALFYHDGVSAGVSKYIQEARDCRLRVKVVTFEAVKTDSSKLSPPPSMEAPKQGSPSTVAGIAQAYGYPDVTLTTPDSTADDRTPNELDAAIPAGRPRKRGEIVVAGEELIPDAKPKKRKPASSGQTDFKHDYKKIYHAAHAQWFQREYPHSFKDGFYTPKNKVPDVTTANGLASFIIDHCAWCGNYANRVNVMGRQIGGITKTRSGATFDDRKFIKASTKKGTADMDLIINSKNIKVEIKIGSDTQKKDQQKQEAKIKQAGGIYVIWGSVDQYLDYFYTLTSQGDIFGA